MVTCAFPYRVLDCHSKMCINNMPLSLADGSRKESMLGCHSTMSDLYSCPCHWLRGRKRAWLAGVCAQLPVLVSDLDLECKMWIKLRLAPMCPYIGSLSLAFVGAPIIKVQLLPYNRVRIMRIPILQVRGRQQPRMPALPVPCTSLQVLLRRAAAYVMQGKQT